MSPTSDLAAERHGRVHELQIAEAHHPSDVGARALLVLEAGAYIR